DELVTNRRREGIISGAQTMAGKLMRGTVTFVSGTVLSMMGFVKGKPDQPYSVQLGIVLMMLVGTCGLALVAIWCSRHMKADKTNLAIVDQEVKRIHNGGKLEDVDPEVKKTCELLSGFKYEDCFGNNNVGYQTRSDIN
ncbi:MFS transporter, partial [Lactobacillus sp. XV13L]|nr:MFS transporter [Lactobacillus sp. XV13L]